MLNAAVRFHWGLPAKFGGFWSAGVGNRERRNFKRVQHPCSKLNAGANPPHITMADGSAGSHGGKGRVVAIFAHLSTSSLRIVASWSLALVALDKSLWLGLQRKGTSRGSKLCITCCRKPMSVLMPREQLLVLWAPDPHGVLPEMEPGVPTK